MPQKRYLHTTGCVLARRVSWAFRGWSLWELQVCTSISWPCALLEAEAMDGAALEASIELLTEGPLGSACSHARAAA